MINLHLGIYEGEVCVVDFDEMDDFISYIKYNLSEFDCIWLAVVDNCDYEEILVTENTDTLFNSFVNGFFNIGINNDVHIHIQEYQTYEDAYAVALSMREANPKCYN